MRAIITAIIFGIGISLMSPSLGHAAEIKQVKGKKVLIQLDGMTVKKGQIFKVLGSNGKAIGLVKIKSIKGDKAIALLGRGKAAKGNGIQLREKKLSKKSKPKKNKQAKSDSTQESTGEPKSAWGFMVGLNQTSAEVVADNNLTEDLKGMGYSIKGMMDYPLIEWLWFRGAAGLEQFSVESSTPNGCAGQTCNADITYLSFDFWGRLVFGSSTRFWLGGGFDVLVPMQKDATALDDNKINNTSVMAFGGGADIAIGTDSYIPIQVEYALYPKSDTVEATALAFRIGYATAF